MTDLREEIGMTPEEILAAPLARLIKSGVRGIVPEQSVEKLRRAAEIALEHFGGDLRTILKLPLVKAKKALKRFPAIGDPGAEKILLFCRAYPILALDSNGIRVLIRLGFGVETPNYSATYRSVQRHIEAEMIKEFSWLIKAHQLLRVTGKSSVGDPGRAAGSVRSIRNVPGRQRIRMTERVKRTRGQIGRRFRLRGLYGCIGIIDLGS